MSLNSDIPLKINSGRDNPQDYKTRSASGNSSKNFKKILDTDPDENKNKFEAKEVGSGSDDSSDIAFAEPDKKMSIFDLKSKSAAEKMEINLSVNGNLTPDKTGNTEVKESPSVLFSKLTAKKDSLIETPVEVPHESLETKKLKPQEHLDNEAIPAGYTAFNEKNNKENFTTRFSTEQPDLTYINPLAIASSQTNISVQQTEKPLPPVKSIQELINQMVDTMSSVRETGKTETIITLKHPPLFEGAQINVTAFDSAKGEFNVTFENLTQAAKNILDAKVHQDSLRDALEQRGYTIHILTTTTITENRPFNDISQGEKRNQDFNDRNNNGQSKGKQQEREA